MGSGRGATRRMRTNAPPPSWPHPVEVKTEPLGVLSRVRNKETGREGKIVAGLVTSVGEVTYSIVYDGGLQEDQKPAKLLEAAEPMAMGEDDVEELRKLDVLGKIVYLRAGGGLGAYASEEAGKEREDLRGRPAQVVAIRTPQDRA